MEFEVRGDVNGGPALNLDHEQFSYAGKFVMTNTGKAVAREDVDILGALSFNRDRTDEDTAWIRYISVRRDHRGKGIGPRLADFVADRLLDSFDRVRIAVNNPFAYEALVKANFGYTGEQTGIAEVVLERPAPANPGYESGLATLGEMDLAPAEEAFVEAKAREGPPPGMR